MDKIWYRNPSKSEVIGRCGGDEKKRMTTQNRQKLNTKICLPSGIKTNSTKMQMDLTIYSNPQANLDVFGYGLIFVCFTGRHPQKNVLRVNPIPNVIILKNQN